MKKVALGLLQWILLVVFVWFLFWIIPQAVDRFKWVHQTTINIMPGYMIILTSLALAFLVVEVWRPFNKLKLFTCIKCFTAWCSIILAFSFGTPFWFTYFFIGAFIGALFTLLLTIIKRHV